MNRKTGLGQPAKRPFVMLFLSLATLILAVGLQYYLVNRPSLVGVSPSSTPAVSPAKVEAISQQLSIEKVAPEPFGLLAAHDGRKGELIEAHFDKAKLSERTLARFQSLGALLPNKPPTDFQRVDLFSNDAPVGAEAESASGDPELTLEEAAATKDDTCRTSIRIEQTGLPVTLERLRLLQTERSGQDSLRSLEMSADGVELKVLLDTMAPPTDRQFGNAQAQGCGKLLKVGDWSVKLHGGQQLEVVVPASSGFRFRFQKLQAGAALWKAGTDGLYEPFELKPSPLKAESVRVTSVGGAADPLLVTAADNKTPLEIKKVLIGDDRLLVEYSGDAFVLQKGAYQSVDLLKRANDYPAVAGLLTMANTALLGWVIHSAKESWKKLRQRQRINNRPRPAEEEKD